MQHRSSLITLPLLCVALAGCSGTGSVQADETKSPSASSQDANEELRPDGGAAGAPADAVTPNPSEPGNGVSPPTPNTAPNSDDSSDDETRTQSTDTEPVSDSSETANTSDPAVSQTPVQSADAGLPSGLTDASTEPEPSGSSPAPSNSDTPPAGHVPALVGVGYGGLRVVSRDNGETWGDQAFVARNGEDDQNLLRAVTYGRGLWLTTGWRLWTSNDAVEWQEHGLVSDQTGLSACNIIEGLAYADNHFYAVCYNGGPGLVFRSTDGLQWAEHATIGDTNQHLFLDYRDGLFVAYGDTNTSFVSEDALSWEVLPGIDQATYCEGEFKSAQDCHNDSWFAGAYYRAEWGGIIKRSTDGSRYVEVYVDDSGNNLYRSRAISQGYAAP